MALADWIPAKILGVIQVPILQVSAGTPSSCSFSSACGGPGFMREFGIESLLRDVMASRPKI